MENSPPGFLDQVEAWSTLGGTVGTVGTLIVALWTLRKTQKQVADERKERQEAEQQRVVDDLARVGVYFERPGFLRVRNGSERVLFRGRVLIEDRESDDATQVVHFGELSAGLEAVVSVEDTRIRSNTDPLELHWLDLAFATSDGKKWLKEKNRVVRPVDAFKM